MRTAAFVPVLAACSDMPTAVQAEESDPAAGTTMLPVPPSSGSGNPFAATALYVSPDSRPARQAAQWRASRPADAARMDRLAAAPEVIWWGDWNTDVRADVARLTQQIAGAGALPVYVAYNIPLRDCGMYSAGGASSATAYRSWIGGIVAGLGSTRAVIILEPDALGGMDCLSATQQAERYALLSEAVERFTTQGSAVYIDAGNPTWKTPAEIASRLQRANVGRAAGFALNVSNFYKTSDNATYGAAVSALVGGKHFVIDTSRNGRGPAADLGWCNPAGRALGEWPTTETGNPLVDALLWIKKPGESDGTCNGGPRAGEWWPEYALGLLERAGY